MSRFKIFLSSILGPAMQTQISLALGFAVTFIVSVLYYIFSTSGRFPLEEPLVPFVFSVLCFAIFGAGVYIQKALPPYENISLRRGAWIVMWTWLLACSITSFYFMVLGFPEPMKIGVHGFWRVFVDGFFEAMSGFTTTGSSILPDLEVFSRSMLFYRALMHWIGGMGIAYLAVTIWKNFKSSREAVINSEAESHDVVRFSSQEEARVSGFDFLKPYILLSGIMVVLMFVSGMFFRHTPYKHWTDNLYDSSVHMFSVLGTGGFSSYNTSAGLPMVVDGQTIIGGVQNPVSEWIMAFFMMFAGINFSLWYIVFFSRKRIKEVFVNKDLRFYTAYVILTSIAIGIIVKLYSTYDTWEAAFRYAFFNVTSIVSTTGLANWDFFGWAPQAIGVLLITYFIGAMVGSTGGGPKTTRFVVAYYYFKNLIKDFIYGSGESRQEFTVDGATYTKKTGAMIVSSIGLYYVIFLVGGILLLLVSPFGVQPNGDKTVLDFGSAMGASIANLGNIGPSPYSAGGFNSGPTGNYYAFSTAGKVVMIFLMFIGRVGVLTFFMLGLKSRGEEEIGQNVPELKFDPESPRVRQ